MSAAQLIAPQHIAVLSRLMFQGYSGNLETPVTDLDRVEPDLEYVSALGDGALADFLRAADLHHVVVRALEVLRRAAARKQNQKILDWCEQSLTSKCNRIAHAVDCLFPICNAFESAGCQVTVIKSLDHWPDLGSDLDLYTTADDQTVTRIMTQQVQAKLEPRSWGDRLANKWSFAVPGLPELVEIHVRYLGQTGEHKAMARRLVERATIRTINGHTFRVAAPEERIVVSTLQRMYRHFYFRLCDMADFAALLQRDEADFGELRHAADKGGIWPGVATFLFLVCQYANQYGGEISLPQQVTSAVHSPDIRVQLRGNFLRVPMLPAASLYGSQLVSAGLNRDLRAMFRLPLLPPLALTALLAYRVTGSDKGVW